MNRLDEKEMHAIKKLLAMSSMALEPPELIRFLQRVKIIERDPECKKCQNFVKLVKCILSPDQWLIRFYHCKNNLMRKKFVRFLIGVKFYAKEVNTTHAVLI